MDGLQGRTGSKIRLIGDLEMRKTKEFRNMFESYFEVENLNQYPEPPEVEEQDDSLRECLPKAETIAELTGKTVLAG